MKTKLIYQSLEHDTYSIIFGNEKFKARYNKYYPKLNTWDLSRLSEEMSNKLFSTWFPCGRKTKFKSLSDIKKFIRDRKYL